MHGILYLRNTPKMYSTLATTFH